MHKIWWRESKQAYYLQIDRKRQKRLGKTQAEADLAYRKWLIEEAGSVPEAEQNKLTVAELGEHFLNHSKTNNDPKTYEFYCYFVVPFVQRFGAATAKNFLPLTFTKWLDEHKGWKGARRNAIIAVKRMFNFGTENRLLPDNPLRTVKRPPKKRRNRILDPKERTLLLSAIRDTFFREYCFALLETGARPMEVARVTAAQVSRDGTRWIFDEHKTDATGEARIIYLTPAMQELTRKLLKQFPEGPLFRSTRRKHEVRRPWTRNGIRCRFKRLREKHPELKGVTCYVLRHSFTTQALVNGVPVPVVSALLGHKSIKMVDEHYNHTDQVTDQLREAAIKATSAVGA